MSRANEAGLRRGSLDRRDGTAAARAHALLLFTAVALALVMDCAFAQIYPVKPISLVVPFSPGGRTDLTARAAAIAGGHIDLDFDIVAPMKLFFQTLGLMVNPG